MDFKRHRKELLSAQELADRCNAIFDKCDTALGEIASAWSRIEEAYDENRSLYKNRILDVPEDLKKALEEIDDYLGDAFDGASNAYEATVKAHDRSIDIK